MSLHSEGVFYSFVTYENMAEKHGRCWNLYDTIDWSTKSDQLLTIYSAGIDKAHST